MDGGSSDGSVEILRAAGSRLFAGLASPIAVSRTRSTRRSPPARARSSVGSTPTTRTSSAVRRRDAFTSSDLVQTSAIVYGHAVMIGADSRVLLTIWAPPYDHRLLRLQDLFIVQPAAFIRRSAIQGDLLDESFNYSMDHELWLRLARDWGAARVPRIVAIDRDHDLRKSYAMRDVGWRRNGALRRSTASHAGVGRAAPQGDQGRRRTVGLGLIRSALREPTHVSDGATRRLAAPWPGDRP